MNEKNCDTTPEIIFQEKSDTMCISSANLSSFPQLGYHFSFHFHCLQIHTSPTALVKVDGHVQEYTYNTTQNEC